MTIAYLGLLALVGLARLAELRISRRNQRNLGKLGVRKIAEPHFRWMVFTHAGILACAAAEVMVLHRPLIPYLAIAMAACGRQRSDGRSCLSRGHGVEAAIPAEVLLIRFGPYLQ